MQGEDGSALPLLSSAHDADPREGELEALLGLAERVLRASEPAEVAAALLDVVVSTYGFARGAVLGGDRRLSLLAGHAVLATPSVPGRSPAVEQAQLQHSTQVLPSLNRDDEPWLSQLLPADADLLLLPLGADERRLGALVLQLPVTLRGRRGRRVLGQLERAATYAGLALHRVQRLGQLQRLAATDDLTMIANRRSFIASLERELARSVRSGEPVSLMLLDIDHFKQVNDMHGHPAGDEALRNVAAALSVACRDLDTAARYGGEEFAVILPDCGVDRCMAIADRLREAVSAAPAVMPLTASAGVATFPVHAGDSEQLVQAADEALLQAKRSGRNRTLMSAGRPAGSTGPDSGLMGPRKRLDGPIGSAGASGSAGPIGSEADGGPDLASAP